MTALDKQPVPTPVHLLSLQWTAERPALHYRTVPGDATIEHRDLVAGEPLALVLSPDKRCIGYYDFVQRRKIPCPFGRHLPERYSQCMFCQRQEVTFYTFTGHAADPEAAETYLQTRVHQAYLNLFGHDLLKVGVAADGRQLQRTLEQGALASLFFAQADGRAIRELETYIHREFHVKDRVTTLQKVRRLAAQPSAAQAEALLRSTAERIAEQLPTTLADRLLPEATFHYHQPKYHLELTPSADQAQLIKRVDRVDQYAGVVRGVVGNLLILEATDQQVYALPMKLLQGHMLRVERGPMNLHITHAPRAVRFEE